MDNDNRMDPAVIRVLERVRSESNMTTLHPNDVERWVSVFPALLDAGYDYDADAVAAWLRSHLAPSERDKPDQQPEDSIYAWASAAKVLRERGPYTFHYTVEMVRHLAESDQ